MISIYVTDTGMSYEQAKQHFKELNKWAKKNCLSYRGCHTQDVSDVSYYNDLITQYSFDDERDAAWFKLKCM
jgi:hypothetical protein